MLLVLVIDDVADDIDDLYNFFDFFSVFDGRKKNDDERNVVARLVCGENSFVVAVASFDDDEVDVEPFVDVDCRFSWKKD